MNTYFTQIKKEFRYYKMLGEKTFNQIPSEKLFWRANDQSNSIAIIVQHLSGNMRSRWTDFFTTDGEKKWREREAEFRIVITSKTEMISVWNKGWNCLFKALDQLSQNDLDRTIYIRNMGHTVREAIHRQLAHYAYHVGQIVFLGKLIADENWSSLSIPVGESDRYNQEKFAEPKERKHFTDDL